MTSNVKEAIILVTQKLRKRSIEIQEVQDLSKLGKYGNARLISKTGEVYHLKFTKSGYKPKDSDRVSTAAKELDEKLKFAIRTFGRGNDTLNGIDEDLLLHLVDLMGKGFLCYFVTILSDDTTLWCRADNFYEFVMRYDTFFKFPKTNVPVCEVPMGWLLPWDDPIIEFPNIII
jgi:hypothetical protein